MRDVKFGIKHKYDMGLVSFDFPAMKDWYIKAHEHSNSWLFPEDSDITIHVNNFDVKFSAALSLDPNGYIDPIVYDADIKFGNSMVTHNNWLLEFTLHQLF